ncbi:MAG: hypothetical protein LBR44_12390, partial [Clostridiales Family XIII bacterium]|nr:hypothetical protein [Clostridiales Family XIII bacterium]
MTTRRMLTLSNRNEDWRVQLSRSVLAFLLAACVALTWVVPIGTAWAEEAPVQAEDVQGDGGSEGQPEGGPAQEQPEGGSGENSGPAPEQPEGGSGQEAGTAQDGDGEQSGDPAPSGEAQPEGGSGTAADGEGAADSASDTEGDATITPDLLIADKTMLSGVTALGIQPLGDADITANLPGITSISGGQKTLMEGYTAEEATVSFNVENQLTNNLGPLHFTSYSNSDKISFTAGNFLNNVGNTIPVEMKLQTGLPAGTYATGVIQGRVSNPGDYDWVFSISPGFTFVVEA